MQKCLEDLARLTIATELGCYVYAIWMFSAKIQYIIIVREPKISGTIPPRGLKFWLQVALSAPFATP